MLIQRDLSYRLLNDQGSYIQIIIGPRQCGKSTLLAAISENRFAEVTFDDLQMRRLANADPQLFLSQHPYPLIIDEVQYAPNIFPELKRIVDQLKKQARFAESPKPIAPLFRLSGSNQILLDKQVKESLVGRAAYYSLNTLSVHEIINAFPDANINDILFRGGWPELYINSSLSTTQYLNDYIQSYLEKDIVLSAGISKQREFHTVLGMLAARTGGFINYSNVAQDSGVRSVTIREWVSVLQRSKIVYLLPSCESNLNKRLIKSPKLYFLDTGLATRLQGWSEFSPMSTSPQIGAMFETLVLGEIVKYIDNFAKSWKLSVWRTKDDEEIDFVIETGTKKVLALDAKLGIHNIKAQSLPKAFSQHFPEVEEMVVVSIGGQLQRLSKTCIQVPIQQLVEYFNQASGKITDRRL